MDSSQNKEDTRGAHTGLLKLNKYPSGDATPHTVNEWHKSALRTIDLMGWGDLIDGDDLPSWPKIKELTRYPEIPPVDGNAHIVAKREEVRANILSDNDIIGVKLVRLRRASCAAIAVAIENSMTPHALHRWEQLKAVHKLTGRYLDGIGMLEEIGKHGNHASSELTAMDATRHEAVIAQARAARLPDGCHVETYTSKVTTALAEHMPYLERAADDAFKVKFLLDCLPTIEGTDTDKRRLMQDIASKGKETDVAYVMQEATALVMAAQRADATPILLAHVPINERFKLAMQGTFPSATPPPIAAAVTKPPNEEAAKKQAAADKTKKEKDRNKKRDEKRKAFLLPEGQLCAQKSCKFVHEGPCYRYPSFEGPIPERDLNNEQKMLRLEADREEVGKRLGMPVKKLMGRPGGKPVPVKLAATDAQSDDDFDPSCDTWGNRVPVKLAHVAPAVCQSADSDSDSSEVWWSEAATPGSYSVCMNMPADAEPQLSSPVPMDAGLLVLRDAVNALYRHPQHQMRVHAFRALAAACGVPGAHDTSFKAIEAVLAQVMHPDVYDSNASAIRVFGTNRSSFQKWKKTISSSRWPLQPLILGTSLSEHLINKSVDTHTTGPSRRC